MSESEEERVVGSLNATLAAKLATKYDPLVESSVREWSSTLLSEPCLADTSQSLGDILHDGTRLCEIVNKLAPNIAKINKSALPFKQMENISNYLKACEMLGLSQGDLFQTIDLFEQKDMNSVCNNLNTLRILALKHNNDLTHLIQKKGPAGSPSLVRSPSSTPARKWSNPAPVAQSALGIPYPASNTSSNKKVSMFSSSAEGLTPSVSSLEDDVKTKEEFKYSSELEQSARQWICDVLEDPTIFDGQTFAQALKSGVVLLKLVNKLAPAHQQKINDSKFGYRQMENIGNYFKSCLAIGLQPLDLFDTPDLYDEKNMNLVINNIHVLAQYVAKADDYKGPTIKDTRQVKTLFSASIIETSLDLLNTSSSSSSSSSSAPQVLSEEHKELVEWTNHWLAKDPERVPPVDNISTCFKSGVVLIRLLSVLAKITHVGSYVKEPTILWHCMQNASTALRLLSEQTFTRFEGCKAQDIVLGSPEPIAALLKYLRDKYDLDYLFLKVLNEGQDTKITLDQLENFHEEQQATADEYEYEYQYDASSPEKGPRRQRSESLRAQEDVEEEEKRLNELLEKVTSETHEIELQRQNNASSSDVVDSDDDDDDLDGSEGSGDEDDSVDDVQNKLDDLDLAQESFDHEQEQKQQEADRLEEERIELEKKEIEEQQEADRKEQERIDLEKREIEDQQRLALALSEEHRLAVEKQLEEERRLSEELQERRLLEEAEIKRQQEADRLEEERLELEIQQDLERQQELDRIEQERIDQEKLDQELIEHERIEQERQRELEILEQERIEIERLQELERQELERIELEQKMEALRLEEERKERERIEADRLKEALRIEKERLEELERQKEAQRLEDQRIALEREKEIQRLEKERVELERQKEADRLEQLRLDEERRMELFRLEQQQILLKEKEKEAQLERDLQLQKQQEKEREAQIQLHAQKTSSSSSSSSQVSASSLSSVEMERLTPMQRQIMKQKEKQRLEVQKQREAALQRSQKTSPPSSTPSTPSVVKPVLSDAEQERRKREDEALDFLLAETESWESKLLEIEAAEKKRSQPQVVLPPSDPLPQQKEVVKDDTVPVVPQEDKAVETEPKAPSTPYSPEPSQPIEHPVVEIIRSEGPLSIAEYGSGEKVFSEGPEEKTDPLPQRTPAPLEMHLTDSVSLDPTNLQLLEDKRRLEEEKLKQAEELAQLQKQYEEMQEKIQREKELLQEEIRKREEKEKEEREERERVYAEQLRLLELQRIEAEEKAERERVEKEEFLRQQEEIRRLEEARRLEELEEMKRKEEERIEQERIAREQAEKEAQERAAKARLLSMKAKEREEKKRRLEEERQRLLKEQETRRISGQTEKELRREEDTKRRLEDQLKRQESLQRIKEARKSAQAQQEQQRLLERSEQDLRERERRLRLERERLELEKTFAVQKPSRSLESSSPQSTSPSTSTNSLELGASGLSVEEEERRRRQREELEEKARREREALEQREAQLRERQERLKKEQAERDKRLEQLRERERLRQQPVAKTNAPSSTESNTGVSPLQSPLSSAPPSAPNSAPQSPPLISPRGRNRQKVGHVEDVQTPVHPPSDPLDKKMALPLDRIHSTTLLSPPRSLVTSPREVKSPRRDLKSPRAPKSPREHRQDNAAAELDQKALEKQKEIQRIQDALEKIKAKRRERRAASNAAAKPLAPPSSSLPRDSMESVLDSSNASQPSSSSEDRPESPANGDDGSASSQGPWKVIVKRRPLAELPAEHSRSMILHDQGTVVRVLKAQGVVRKRVLQELMQTERSYVQSLEIVENLLVEPIRAASKTTSRVMKDSEFASAFSNISSILANNRRLLELLEERASNDWGDLSTIGDIFIDNISLFEEYQAYLSNYDVSLITIHFLGQKYEKFKKMIKAFEQAQMSTNKLDLASFLIMPVQRLPRYTMLLRDMLKYTGKHHPDQDLISKAVALLQATLTRINREIDPLAGQHAHKLLSVSNSICNPDDLVLREKTGLVVPGRKFIREGYVMLKKSRHNRRLSTLGAIDPDKTGKVYCFLFGDLLLVTENMTDSKAKAEQQPFFYLDHLYMIEVKEILASKKKEGSLKVKLLLLNKHVWALKFQDLHERNEWDQDIQRCFNSSR